MIVLLTGKILLSLSAKVLGYRSGDLTGLVVAALSNSRNAAASLSVLGRKLETTLGTMLPPRRLERK